MTVKTGRRKQAVSASGSGNPGGDHDPLPPLGPPHMMTPHGPHPGGMGGDPGTMGPQGMPMGSQGPGMNLGPHMGPMGFFPGQGGPMQGGPMQGGPMQGGPMQVGPMQGSPMQGGPMQGGPMQGGPMQGSPMQGGPMQGGPMQGGPMQGGPMQGGPMQGSPGMPGLPNGMQGHGPPPMPGHSMMGAMGPGPAMTGPMHVGPGGPNHMNPAFFRRHTPYFGQPDYRLYELNKRLQQRSEESDNLWWDAFATEFFEDDATLTLQFCLEDGPKRYSIGRTLIPRYFRSIFEGGVTELYYTLKHPKESFHNTSITLDCDHCTMITHHGKSMYTKVCTDGRLILEFTFDDLMRVKSWHFQVRGHRELIPRSVVAMHSQQDPGMVETLSKNITRQGITSQTLNYLRLCVILEPMQELMSRHKAYALSPRDCLKTTLFQKWQRMVAPPGGVNQANGKGGAEGETQRPTNKRRKRKGSSSGQPANSNSMGAGKKRSPGPNNFTLATQVSDVMVVGEPSLMGGEFGDEDERLITRLENSQYDTSTMDDNGQGQLGPPGPYSNSPMTGGPSGGWNDPGRPPQDPDKKSPTISQ